MGQRGAVWWGVWTIAFVFLCAYIAFDVLDVDGSQLHFRSGLVLTVGSASAEADRVIRPRQIPHAVRLRPYTLALHLRLPLRLATTPLRRFRGERLPPRRQLSRAARLTLSADPV
jgi:hypothetical protein